MGEKVEDATVFIAFDDTLNTTSSDYHALVISGDTVRLCTERNPSSSTDTGNKGEMCWGSQTVLGITTYYLYLCVDTNTWRRVAVGLTF